jgi:5'(3')-deoxyribonucleotidase
MGVRIYIDLDGTICDIKKAVYEFRLKNGNLNPNDIQFKYPWSLPGFFLGLEPIPGAIESVKQLASVHDVWFLSRPSFKNTHSYTEKAEWIKEHFGYEMQKKLILCGDKSLLIGRILIDDAENGNQRGFNGVWLKIGSERFPTWDEINQRVKEISDLGINSL